MLSFPTSRILPIVSAALLMMLVSSVVQANPVSNPITERIESELGLSKFSVQSIDLPPNPEGEVDVLLQLDGVDTALILETHSIRADEYVLLVEQHGSLVELSPPKSRTWRGTVMQVNLTGMTVGYVRSSMKDGSLWARIVLDDGRIFAVEPLSKVVPEATADLHVVYSLQDVVGGDWDCGADLVLGSAGPPARGGSGGTLAATGLQVCEVGVDADFEFYGKNGSSVDNTVFDVENIINGVESIYEVDVGITYEVTAVVVRTTSASNPYTTSDPSSLLGQFRSHWSNGMSAVIRDVAHLFTGRNMTGSTIGIAYLNGICNSQAYGVSESRFSSNYAYRVALTAHELGHNWSSGHCSGSDCRIMCSGLGGCSGIVTSFGSSSKSSISNYRNSKSSCLPALPDAVPLPLVENFSGGSLDSTVWTHSNGAQVNSNATNEPSPSTSLNLDASGSGDLADDEVRSNYLLASGASNASLSYQTQLKGLESGEELVIEYWSTGLAWEEVNRITSTGATETVFTPHSHSLPANAQHNEFRVRFRAEVSNGNDDCYVDDVVVQVPPPSSPTITSVTPSSAKVLNAPNITLDGTSFATASALNVGSTVLLPGEYTVVNDMQIVFLPPAPSTLGPVSVTVTNSVGTSNAVTLTYVQNDPPLLVAPIWAFNGQELALSWAGDPLDVAFVSFNIDGSTFSFNGNTLLSPAFLFQVPSLNAVGLGGLNVVPSGVPSGTMISMQIWFMDPGSTTTTLEATNIDVIQFLF